MERLSNLLFFVILLLFTTSFTSFTADKVEGKDPALGVWISEKGDSKFEIYKKNNRYYGKLVWADPYSIENKPYLDVLNPDESLRGRNLLGEDLLVDFEYRGDGVYRSGKVYDPQRGKYYSCKITVEGPDKALIRGYILFPALGRTEIAYRVK